MPRLIRPTLPSTVETAVGFLGSRAQSDILRHLGPSTVGQLQAVLEIGRPSLNRHLEALARAGLIETDPPRGQRQGRDVTYEVQRETLRQLLRAYADYVEGR
jgi:DNA-binding transcriptional ArsR family regulator